MNLPVPGTRLAPADSGLREPGTLPDSTVNARWGLPFEAQGIDDECLPLYAGIFFLFDTPHL